MRSNKTKKKIQCSHLGRVNFFYTDMRQLYTAQPDGSKMLQNHRKHFGNHAKCMDDASLCCAK